MNEEGGGIAVGEEVCLWGGRRELVEGNDEGEDNKSGDEGLHLEAALDWEAAVALPPSFLIGATTFSLDFCPFGFLDFSFKTRGFRISLGFMKVYYF
ncbi:hypothetical protein MRB53_007157 [Persea americana]|uniref:Uncharacterized protein n=1 Tax=Persea americana TaxID=3435 RepID=A0ACC2MIF0_PERAE|nr:hypothetical protein MRB53_007157 [Persea americana]